MKVIFIVPYPTEGASTRYRVEQFIPYLKRSGVGCTVRSFVSPKFYSILYKKNHYTKKIFYFLLCSAKRFVDVFRALRYDIIFLHLEAFPFGPPVIEYFWAMLGKKIAERLNLKTLNSITTGMITQQNTPPILVPLLKYFDFNFIFGAYSILVSEVEKKHDF